ncbi:MAG: hypothetical protein WC866_00240 [Patescibacteria group bacterium]|jgi:hypothetical protein
MAREYRKNPTPEAVPEAKDDDITDRFDVSDLDKPVAAAKKPRSRKKATAPKVEEIEDLTEHLVEDVDAGKEPSVPANDNEPYEEISITEDVVAEKKPSVKRAKRQSFTKEELAKVVAASVETTPEAPESSQKEEAWFKQGEDESYVKSLAEKQRTEDARKEADVRRSIAESYDTKKTDTIIDTDEELEAATKHAEIMLANGELNPEVFNAKDYRFQLMERARLDRELETAGWWQARKLRAELKETQKNLADYEQQLASVSSERAGARDTARKVAPDYEEVEVREGMPLPKPAMKPGSGTSKKPGFFARLFGR